MQVSMANKPLCITKSVWISLQASSLQNLASEVGVVEVAAGVAVVVADMATVQVAGAEMVAACIVGKVCKGQSHCEKQEYNTCRKSHEGGAVSPVWLAG